jgi:AraC-like DNA-binding protein
MSVQFFYPDGRQLIFQKVERKQYRGVLLPGSEVQQTRTSAAVITMQEFQHRLFRINYRLLEIFSKIKFSINESAGLRFEALLTGEMHVSVNGEKRKFKAGEYRITDIPLLKALFKKNMSCGIFITYYSNDLLEQLGIEVASYAPRRMPDMMTNLINEMLSNPYSESLRNFYYENCIRELLFLHLTQDKNVAPGELMNKDIATIYKADSIIAADLQKHYTIDELSRMSGTNKLKLKIGFKKVYGIGVFKRLVFRRMEHAKMLLESTDKSIGEIASLTGYDTVAGFIHAFRREFGLTPREWRKKEKESDKDDFAEE